MDHDTAGDLLAQETCGMARLQQLPPRRLQYQEETTKHFAMARILKREFCGICHLTVAFPMNDCKRCHPGRLKHQE